MRIEISGEDRNFIELRPSENKAKAGQQSDHKKGLWDQS